MVPSVCLPRDPMAHPVSPARDPVIPPVFFFLGFFLGIGQRLLCPLLGVRRRLLCLFEIHRCVSSSGSGGTSCVRSSGSGGAFCVSCLYYRDTSCCFSSYSCTSSCGVPLLSTDASSLGFTARSLLPLPVLPILSGPSIYCTACRFSFRLQARFAELPLVRRRDFHCLGRFLHYHLARVREYTVYLH